MNRNNIHSNQKVLAAKPANSLKPRFLFKRQQLVASLQALGLSLLCPLAYADDSASSTAENTEDVKQLAVVQVVGKRTSEAEVAIGKGQSHNTVAITHKALLSAPAGTSGLKMLENLAGFNVQTNDPLGLYEFGNSVSVRAFNFQQIGFVLDGIPLGRNDAFGGSPIFRYVEN